MNAEHVNGKTLLDLAEHRGKLVRLVRFLIQMKLKGHSLNPWDTLIFLVSVMMNTYQHSFRKQGRRDESSVAIFPPSGQGIANAI